jgi:hypothetical protein
MRRIGIFGTLYQRIIKNNLGQYVFYIQRGV